RRQRQMCIRDRCMIDFLYSIDVSIFYFINRTLANPIFDWMMPFITDIYHWYLVYILLWLILFFKGGKYRIGLALMILILITISDQLSSSVIKDIFERVRPCNVLPDVHLLVGCSSSYSFPSSHAVNNFCMATFFSFYFKNLKWIFFSVAFIVALSRVFVGVHYPSDVIGGALIGIAIGYFGILSSEFIFKKIYK
ncbi:MAG: phosphatase PAP2 family protein, partial [Ignavibacteria bacterium]|nr:phosphatase PAP2 family protein [Ignavibacteria bacterium]